MAPVSRICKYRFMMSDDDYTSKSYATINSLTVYGENAQPAFGGVYDPRGGPVDNKFGCQTCLMKQKECPGHRCHIDLNVGVLMPIAILEVRRWLRVICLSCGAPIVDTTRKKSLKVLATTDTTGKACPRCRAIHPKIIKNKDDYFTYSIQEAGESEARNLFPDEIRQMFERISNNTIEIFGKQQGIHPKNYVMRKLPVASNVIRPGSKSYTGIGNNHNDTTNLLQTIVDLNNKLKGIDLLKDEINASNYSHAHNLFLSVYELMVGSNSNNATQDKTGKRRMAVNHRVMKSLLQSLGSKEGLIRSHLLGKRVFSISRSTICGNCAFAVDEVGLPINFARTMQVEETVQEFNIDYLTTFLLNGRKQYPGCSYIIRKSTGKRYEVGNLRDFYLEVGDIIYRDVIDGDIAYFTRQPALKQGSLNCHHVVIIWDPNILTIQMNVIACTGYNADFDGDQMNIWVVNRPGARIEASILSHISNTFIDVQNSGPLNGQVLDSTIGGYYMTKSRMRLNKFAVMSLFAGINSPAIDKPMYTGRDVVSLLLRNTPIEISKKPKSFDAVHNMFVKYDPEETKTVIKNGKMISGVLDKNIFGNGATGGIFHIIAREFGSRKALDMLFEFQQVILNFMDYRGHTFCYSDMIFPKEVKDKIKKITEASRIEAQEKTDDLMAGRIIAPFNSTVEKYYMEAHTNALKLSDEQQLKCSFEALDYENNGLLQMIKTGSNGSLPNLFHMCVAIGSVNVNNERIRETFSYRRTMPYYPRFSNVPDSIGFIDRCYIDGLTPVQYICGAMCGRYDLISKSLSTASTGENMRKGIMSNNSSVVNYQMQTAKNDRIVQTVYGDDGLNPKAVESINIKTLSKSNTEIKTNYYEDVADLIMADRDIQRKNLQVIESIEVGAYTPDTSIMLSINMDRIIAMVNNTIEYKDIKEDTIEIKKEIVHSLCARLPYAFLNETQESLGTEIPKHFVVASWQHVAYIRSVLFEKGVLEKLSIRQLNRIVDVVRKKYANSLVGYGSAVGINATHAISEPLTQYMLNSHHRSVAGGTSTSTIVKVQEIMGAKKMENEKSPTMLLPMHVGVTEKQANFVANNIEYMTLNQFTNRYDVIYENHMSIAYPEFIMDYEWMSEFLINYPFVVAPSKVSDWCYRIVLNRTLMVHKSIDLETIVHKIREHHPTAYVLHSPEASSEIVIRVWISTLTFKKTDKQTEVAVKNIDTVLDTPVRGIEGIKSAKVITINRKLVGADGEYGEEFRYAVKTEGTNIADVVIFEDIDPYLITSSSVDETFKLFGIDAANNKLVSEIFGCIGHGKANARHVYTYACEMTRTGKVTNIERGGVVQREHNNTLLHLSNGDVRKVATESALNGLQSDVYGISAPLLLGTVPMVGTNFGHMVVDEDFLSKQEVKSVDSILDSI